MVESTMDPEIVDEPAKPQRKLSMGYGAAMMLLVVLASNATMLFAAALFDVYDQIAWRRSTGGFLTLIAGAITWATCRSWSGWRKAAWVWALLTLIIGLITMAVNVNQAEQAFSPTPETSIQDTQQVPESVPAGLSAEACQKLFEEIETYRAYMAGTLPEKETRGLKGLRLAAGQGDEDSMAEYQRGCL